MARVNEEPQSDVPQPRSTHGADAADSLKESAKEALVSPEAAKNPKDAVMGAATKAAGSAAAKVVPGGEEAVEKVAQARKIAMQAQAIAEGAKSALMATKGAASALAPLVANPVFWIVVLVIIVLVIVLINVVAGSQVLGRNENANGCGDATASSGVEAVWSEDRTATANSIGGWLTSTSFAFLGGKPMSVNQAAAFIGNWVQESGLNPSAGQNGAANSGSSNADIRAIQGGNLAVGLVQWDGGRRGGLADFADSKGKIWNDLTTQLGFVQQELDGGYGATLMAEGFGEGSKSVDDLVDIINRHYEVSGDGYYEGNPELTERRNNRVAAAKGFLGSYNGGYSSAPGGGCLTDKASGAGFHPLGGPTPISDPFGMRLHPIYGDYRMHYGTDWNAGCDHPLYAMVSGTITFQGSNGGFGNLSILTSDDGTLEVYYAHQPFGGSSILPQGSKVNGGDQVGQVGTTGSSTGCHAHIETHKNGETIDPVGVLAEMGIAP